MHDSTQPAGNPGDPRSPLQPASPQQPADAPPTSDTPLKFGPSDAELQAQLKAYRQAIEQEYAAQKAQDPDQAEIEAHPEKHTREFFRKNLPDAAAQIVFLSGNSNSDTVKLNASKFIVQSALAEGKEDEDTITDLLKQLTKPVSKVTS